MSRDPAVPSRRQFLETSGLIAASAALVGCDDERTRRLFGMRETPQSFDVPTATSIDEVSHIIARLTYGARPGERERVRALGATPADAVSRYIEEQLSPSRHDTRADHAVRRLEALAEPVGELYEFQAGLLRDQLGAATMLRAVYGERQLHEVMVGVWTDHFNIDISKGDCRWLTPAYDRDVIRPHALGRFPDLLRSVVLSPAMLWYLDGRVNRRATPADRPNENYARELLELHTLGVHGGYTQHDVMEVARALTGWTVRSKGASRFGIGLVEFQADAHDDGPKTILGREIPAGGGRQDVERVLEIVTSHPACAQFIATKLCRRFIDDDPPAAAVAAVARTFLETHGDIAGTLRTVFSTSEFQSHRGTRFKRPFHFVASALRALDAETDGGPPLLQWLERMGQASYQYPTPDGYPDVAAPWLGGLLWRWQFATALVAGRIEGTRIDATTLRTRAGDDAALMAHLLGRTISEAERAALRTAGNSIALALSSPTFQLI